jgi:hypothetical protein
MLRRLLLPLGTVALLASCSVLIDVDGKQCGSNADCAALSPGSVCQQSLCVQSSNNTAGTNGSGGSPDEDPLVCKAHETSKQPKVKYSFAPIFANPPKEPKPFTIKACNQFDLECNSPVFGPIDANADEPRDFEVEPGFDGYFEIRNPDTLSAMLFLGRPVVEDTVGWNMTVPDQTTVVQLGLATGTIVNPELGLVISVSRDCDAMPLSGVTVTNSEGGIGFYLINNLPNTSITETGPQGALGFVNIPISTTTLTGVHNETGTELGPVSVRVKPGWISLGELFP